MLKTPNHQCVRYHQCGVFDTLDSILSRLKHQPDGKLKERFEAENKPQLHRITGDLVLTKDK